MTLQRKTQQLFAQQTTEWPLAQKNFSDLENVETKTFSLGEFDVKVQYNPARIASSGAKTDAKSIAQRPCFLCATNRPTQQTSLAWKDYEILANPFPILPEHYTIAKRAHVPQQILPVFADMLELAYELSELTVFYNGPQCGASAPDHLHFQAGSKHFLPLTSDYKRIKGTHATLLHTEDEAELFVLNNYQRTVYCIEAYSIYDAQVMFEQLYARLPKLDGNEPMMNIVCTYEDRKWYIYIMPRKAFRPWQYTAEPSQQLLISPATVEMSGIFITPIKEHFDRITKDDIIDIMTQVSLGEVIKTD